MERAASTEFQSVMYWPRNCCTPSVIVWVEFGRGEDQRKPEVVPDRNDGEDRDGGDRRPQERRDDLEENARLRHPVAARRVAQVLRDLLDEFAQDEDRQRQPLRNIDEDQGRQRVVEAGLAHHGQDRDRAEADRHHDADRKEERERGRAPEPVFGQRPGRHCAEQQDKAHADQRDDQRIHEIGSDMRGVETFA